jgi:hypothetical protein
VTGGHLLINGFVDFIVCYEFLGLWFITTKEKPDHYRIRVKDVPCSADDGQIYRYLEKQLMCVIHNHYRERLRVDGFSLILFMALL